MSVPPPHPHASTSTLPSTLPQSQSNGHHVNEDSKPAELPPYERVDIEAIKQELHDLLGENGLPYWKALNGFILGQLRRDELVSMVKKWLKGPHRKSTT
jgi:transcriptional coactivator HFI1/ADA1